MAQTVKRLSAMRETWVRSLGREDSLKKEMATHSSALAWRIHGRRSLVQATVHGVAKSRARLSDFTSLHFKLCHSFQVCALPPSLIFQTLERHCICGFPIPSEKKRGRVSTMCRTIIRLLVDHGRNQGLCFCLYSSYCNLHVALAVY